LQFFEKAAPSRPLPFLRASRHLGAPLWDKSSATYQHTLAAKEENRELIRAKIALVKAEMKKAHLRAEQHARERQQF
jgi:hypothetical protein